MTQRIYPVVLSGGAGTRLWPLSRRDHPKQLIPLTGPYSPFAETLRRVADPMFQPPVVVSNEAYRFAIVDEMADIGVNGDIVLEPEGRDSGPAILAAAVFLAARDDEAIVLVLPSDHHIPDPAAFRASIADGVDAALSGHIVTFGITPTHPETGYGYISTGDGIEGAAPALTVAGFIEKPATELALQLMRSGCFWNSGMFMFRADALIGIAEKLQPRMLAAVREAVDGAQSDLSFQRLAEDAFRGAPAISFDHAIMEKTDRAAVVPVSFAWSDMGTWEAVWIQSARDENGNATLGDTVLEDVRNAYVRSEGPLTVVAGIEDVNVIVTQDAVLVAGQGATGKIKTIAAKLAAEGRSEALHHRRVHRPWGWFESLQMGERFQVKRIMVKPGHKLSLQKHHHRAEHWVVVKGSAEVTVDDKVTILGENESTYIPMGAVHRLGNPGKIPVEIIEIQSGAYLGEDDIVRFSDDYGRGG
ncbi:MAG: mannose-1-phosphate guanylyltransferase/mannose-6-phosphate isomerase [Flavobacteriaceae bacterium]